MMLEKKLHAYEENFPHIWEKMMQDIHCGGDAVWLIRHASYIFRTDGELWAVDMTLRTPEMLSAVSGSLPCDTAELKFILISHLHNDHFNEQFLKLIAENKTLWVIPSFFPEELKRRLAQMHENTVFVKSGDTLTVGGTVIDILPGRHVDADGSAGCESLGFAVTTSCGKRIVLPGDTRDYSAAPRLARNTDALFAHVWFGREAAMGDWQNGCNDFCRFVSSYNAKKIFLTHLYALSREPEDMWTQEHADAACAELLRQNGSCRFSVPAPGERTELF